MKLSLRWKIAGGFGLMLLLIGILGWVTLGLFSNLRDVQRRVFDDAVPGLVDVNEIVRSYTAQSSAVRGYIIGANQTFLDQFQREVDAARKAEERAESSFTSGDEAELLVEIRAAGRSYEGLIDSEIVPLVDEGSRASAISLLIREGDPLIADIESLGSVLLSSQENVLEMSEVDAQTNSSRALVILILVTAGALAIGLLLAFLLPRRMGANLSRLVEAARAIGRGDLEQKVEIGSGDELQELSERFVEMQSGLKRLQQLALQDRELEIAASIQRGLLQRNMPKMTDVSVLPIHRQANLVGGDWYDVDESKGIITVAVGDASGKGIGAALMATVVLSVIRAERRLGSTQQQIIERANEALREANDSDSFLTLIYVTINPTHGRVQWLNMGHHPPFLIRANVQDGQEAGEYLEGSRNKALGWYEDPGYELATATIDPGDRLVFYTDGFLEAKSADGEVFGEHRFAQSLSRLAPLPSSGIADDVIRDVERFAAGKLDDDLTMLIVEYKGTRVSDKLTEGITAEEEWHSRK